MHDKISPMTNMKQFMVLILLLVVLHVDVYAHDSNEKSLSEVSRKRLLVNLLHALRTLRDHKKVKSTSITLPKFDYVHSNTEHRIESHSNLFSPTTKSIDDFQSTRNKNQINKRSKGIHRESTGIRDRRPRNGKELFLQLLQTLKRIKERKNGKRGQRTNLSTNNEKHGIKIKGNKGISSFAPPHNRNKIPDFDQRSNVLTQVKKIAKIGTSQANKARYSFAKARLSFLQALETAQDEKLTKLGNLEQKFSYILPKGEESNRENVVKDVKYALQDFTKDQLATALSHIHQPYKKLFHKPSLNGTPIKHSRLEEPLEKKINLPIPILQEQKNVTNLSISVSPQNEIEDQGKAMSTPNVHKKSAYKNNRKPNGISSSMVNELLSISNARNKLEKLTRLRKLQAKLLNHFAEDKTKKKNHENSQRNSDNKSIMSPWRINDGQKRPITWKAGTSLFNNVPHRDLANVNKVSKYKTSQKVVYGKPSKRYNEHQSVQVDGNKNFLFPGNSSSDKVSYANEQHATPVGEHIDTFDDFVDSTQDRKEPIHSVFGSSNLSSSRAQSRLEDSPGSYFNHANNTVQNTQDKIANIHSGGVPPTVDKNQSHYQYPPGYGNKTITLASGAINKGGLNTSSKNNEVDENHHSFTSTAMLQTQHTERFDPSQHVVTEDGNKPITSLHGINGNSSLKQSTMNDEVKDIHNNTGRIVLLQKQNSKHLADPSQHIVTNFSESHDINIIGTTSSRNQTEPKSDQSYLPLESSAPPPLIESEDSKNPLSSVVSEHDKIISELTSSKTLAKHLSNDKGENSHKTLSKVLQKAQDMFLKKVKEILAGNKTNGQEKVDINLDGNKSMDNSSQKSKGGVINTSAYVMDESPPNANPAAKVHQDTSGIVPKTPTNDDLVAQSASPLQTAGSNTPMQSLQSPMDPNLPLISQSVEQTGHGHPVSGQPLTYAQLQDAHEEERVALQQENDFRGIQNGVTAQLNNGANEPMNSATIPYQSYAGSNQLPEANHYSIHNPGFHAPNVDDLSEYRGGMERYQLSHHIGYDGAVENEDGIDDYLPRRHHFHSYGHRVADEDDEDDGDYNDDDDDVDEDGEKKSSIGKPHHSGKHKHLKKYHFRTASNSTTTRIDHRKHEKVDVKPKANATTRTKR